jgi:hypothetical protein
MSTEPETTEGEQKPSPYIRTFAKDFAALAAKNPELAAAEQSKHKAKAPTRKELPKIKVEKPKSKESQLDEEAASIDARTREGLLSIPKNEKPETQESIELPKIDLGDIVVNAKQPESIKPPLSSEPSDAERAEILARLKARASANIQSAPIVEQIPIQEPPKEIPSEKVISPIIPTPVIPVENNSKNESSPIHTYKTDFNDHVEEKKASAFSIIAAEKDAAKQRVVAKPAPNNNRKVLTIIAGILLLLIGSGGVYAAYLYMNKNAPVLLVATPSSLIASDLQVKLSGSGLDLMRALTDQAKQQLPDSSVELTYLDVSTTTAQGVTEAPASGGAFITELNLQAPDILLRNIDSSSMVGVTNADGKTAPFFILRVTSYERTFAGMLQWEPSMLSALSPLYPLYPAASADTASSSTSVQNTASSSVSKPIKIFVPPADPTAPASQFVDEVVANHSARALKDNAGRTLVLYGYADKQTLIIAGNEGTFSLLIEKLAANGN